MHDWCPWTGDSKSKNSQELVRMTQERCITLNHQWSLVIWQGILLHEILISYVRQASRRGSKASAWAHDSHSRLSDQGCRFSTEHRPFYAIRHAWSLCYNIQYREHGAARDDRRQYQGVLQIKRGCGGVASVGLLQTHALSAAGCATRVTRATARSGEVCQQTARLSLRAPHAARAR
jgi:hypothetical protein